MSVKKIKTMSNALKKLNVKFWLNSRNYEPESYHVKIDRCGGYLWIWIFVMEDEGGEAKNWSYFIFGRRNQQLRPSKQSRLIELGQYKVERLINKQKISPTEKSPVSRQISKKKHSFFIFKTYLLFWNPNSTLYL